jgi:hypothetical protein
MGGHSEQDCDGAVPVGQVREYESHIKPKAVVYLGHINEWVGIMVKNSL